MSSCPTTCVLVLSPGIWTPPRNQLYVTAYWSPGWSSQSPREQVSVRNRRGSPEICGPTVLLGSRIRTWAELASVRSSARTRQERYWPTSARVAVYVVVVAIWVLPRNHL